MHHRLFSLFVLVAAVGFPAYSGSQAAEVTAGGSSATLTVIWAKAPDAKPRPFTVALIEPADGIAVKGRIPDPRHRQEVFTYRQGRAIERYYLEVRKQRCDDSGCELYPSLCTRKINVDSEESLTATVRLQSQRECVIRLAG